MCTVSYIPLNQQDFILTSSRDEALTRKPATPPQRIAIADKTIFCPIDKEKEGTWIATSNCAYTLCLLNGAFLAHKQGGIYKRSRGMIIKDFFTFENKKDFLSNYEFSDFEPFTLLIVQNIPQLEITELRWDGNELFVIEKDANTAMIWSSSTLYSDEMVCMRKKWFETWQKSEKIVSSAETLKFHLYAGEGDPQTNVQMKRASIQTVSITAIEKNATNFRMLYKDIIADKEYRYAFIF